MTNTSSPRSRRFNFICDKTFYEGLRQLAAAERTSVGALIRRALQETYPTCGQPRETVEIRAVGDATEVLTVTPKEFHRIKLFIAGGYELPPPRLRRPRLGGITFPYRPPNPE